MIYFNGYHPNTVVAQSAQRQWSGRQLLHPNCAQPLYDATISCWIQATYDMHTIKLISKIPKKAEIAVKKILVNQHAGAMLVTYA